MIIITDGMINYIVEQINCMADMINLITRKITCMNGKIILTNNMIN